MIRTALTTALLLTSLALPANAINRSPAAYDSPLIIEELDPLGLWLERLAFSESSGREHIVILDRNGLKSHSCLQFQIPTFEEQTAKYGLAGNIMDCAFQKQLARKMLESDPKSWRHWLGSTRKLGKPPVPGA